LSVGLAWKVVILLVEQSIFGRNMKNRVQTKKHRVIIWGAWYGSRNIGDRLLLLTITDMLYENIGHIELTILSAQPDLIKEYFKPPNGTKYQVIKPKKQLLKLIISIVQCNVIIFGGGVPFFDQYKQALFMLFIVSVAKLFKKPYFVWCCSSYQIHHKINQYIYKYVLNHAIKTTCREKYTLEIFSNLGIKSVPEIVQDSVFSLTNYDYLDARRLINKYLPNSDDKKLFALTPRTLRIKNNEAQTHYNEKTDDDIQHQYQVYSMALDWLLEKGYLPVFIPMNTNSPDDDRLIARSIIENSKKGKEAVLIDEMIMPRTAPALYSYFAGSIVSRVHGGVTSFLGLCPPIMYAFETKHVGIMESMGLDEFIFAVDKKPEEIIKYLIKLEKDNLQIKEFIKNRRLILANDAKIPCQYITEFLK
jgi:polysaccharide pyruvyl transferase WcaK-like protein